MVARHTGAAPPARPPIAYDRYRALIENLLAGEHYVWFAKFVVAGEFLVGIALVIGLFIGLAAFFSAFMSRNFIMAGSASIDGVLLALSMLLMLAWKTAGWWSLDRRVLPRLYAPRKRTPDAGNHPSR